MADSTSSSWQRLRRRRGGLHAASAGKSVLVVERGVFAGAKNMTGGRIYSHS